MKTIHSPERFFYLMLIIALMQVACKHDPVIPDDGQDPIPSQTCDSDTVYFQNDILPLLNSGCASSGCHNAASAQDGVVLTDYASIIRTGKVKAGNPGNSKLYKVLIENDPNDRMPPPPRTAFTTEQITKVRRWIEQGAKNNLCESNNCDTLNVSFATHIQPMIQNNCTGCHSGNQPQGGISLNSHATIAASAISGRLLGSVTHSPGYVPMPQGAPKLDNCKIIQLTKWINNGTPNN
ncbi:MAG TPA: hypothetical protein PKE03_05175 [Bacteroidales bacterium]|nr:hypothetical protein [Bacteroidales bacterium]